MSRPKRGRNDLIVRILRMVEILKARPATFGDLAAALGVSERTVRRDMAALEEVYAPITVVDEEGVGRAGRPRPRFKITGPVRFAA